MPRNDFIPAPDANFDQWLANFLTQLTGQAATVGISPNEVAQMTGLVTTWHTEFGNWTTTDAQARQQRAKKDAARAAWETIGRPLIRRVKAHPNFTEDIGELLKVIGPEDTTDLSASKPTLTVKLLPGTQVQIGFPKGTKADGLNIYCQRDGDAAPVFLARDTQSPYVDNRPLLVVGKPEVRKYRAVYVSHDAEIGQMSDEVVVTVTP